MVKTAKIFAYILFITLAFIVFIPKSSVYYFAEKNLKEFGVINSKEKINENLFSLELENSSISAKGIEVAEIENSHFTLLLIYNTLEFTNIKLSSLVNIFLPPKIHRARISYSIFNPLFVKAEGNGEFGDATAAFSLLDRELKVLLKPSKVMLKSHRASLRQFKKNKEGEYVYARKF